MRNGVTRLRFKTKQTRQQNTNIAPGGRATAFLWYSILMMNSRDRLTLKCFSPAVMMLTFIIEVVAMLWVLWKHRDTMVGKLIATTLAFLAIFQFAEYMICERAIILSSLEWAKIGFASISILPALGMHMALKLSGEHRPSYIYGGYAMSVGFAIFFLTAGHGIAADQCAGNYVIFKMMPSVVYFYAAFYYAWTIAGMLFAYKMSKKKVKNRKALLYLAAGYASFIIPTSIVNIINPETIHGIPSIMCGFAVILALCLVFGVIPNTHELQKDTKKSKPRKLAVVK